jgi:hypothetical protein
VATGTEVDVDSTDTLRKLEGDDVDRVCRLVVVDQLVVVVEEDVTCEVAKLDRVAVPLIGAPSGVEVVGCDSPLIVIIVK